MSLNTSVIKGNGPPLLMLHGWGQKLDNMHPLGEVLSPISHPHLVDLPGFGKSAIPDRCWSAYDYADEMIRYLDTNHIKKCGVLGHSFGGKVAMCLAIRYPERINKLILLSPSGLRPKKTLRQKLRLKGIRLSGKLLKVYDKVRGTDHYKSDFIPRFGSRDYKNADAMRPILVRSVNEDLASEIPKIQCQTLLLWGEKDTETPPEMGYRLSNLIPHSKLIMFPMHDHYLLDNVGSHLCATVIRPFFEEVK